MILLFDRQTHVCLQIIVLYGDVRWHCHSYHAQLKIVWFGSCCFQQSFSHITTISASCMRRDSSFVWSAAYTDAPCRWQKTQVHYLVTLSWHQVNQSWFYHINTVHLARKLPVPFFTTLVSPVWHSRGSNPRPPDYEAITLWPVITGPPTTYRLLADRLRWKHLRKWIFYRNS